MSRPGRRSSSAAPTARRATWTCRPRGCSLWLDDEQIIDRPRHPAELHPPRPPVQPSGRADGFEAALMAERDAMGHAMRAYVPPASGVVVVTNWIEGGRGHDRELVHSLRWTRRCCWPAWSAGEHAGDPSRAASGEISGPTKPISPARGRAGQAEVHRRPRARRPEMACRPSATRSSPSTASCTTRSSSATTRSSSACLTTSQRPSLRSRRGFSPSAIRRRATNTVFPSAERKPDAQLGPTDYADGGNVRSRPNRRDRRRSTCQREHHAPSA
jgi:hypothetical protein